MDIAIAVDLSGSTDLFRNLSKAILQEILLGLNIAQNGIRCSLVVFSDTAMIRYYLDTYSNSADMLLASVLQRNIGKTNLQDALRLIREDVFQPNRGDRPTVQNAVVLITDGDHNVQQSQTVVQAEMLKNSSASIFAVAIGDNVNMDLLSRVVTDGEGSYLFRILNNQEVPLISDRLLSVFCQ